MQKDFTQTYHYALHEAFGNGTTSTSAPITTTPSTEATTTTQNGKQELSSSRYLAMLLFTAVAYLR